MTKALLSWYRRSRRDLPWRGAKDPYAILVSELMLQQTTVKTVLEYYRPFMQAFPTLKSLARAEEESVLQAWSGLGYYRRARHLQAAARRIHNDLGGKFPRTLEGIRSLPGVGAYTAAAVGSIAFGIPEPVLDGNVIRVTARLGAVGGDPGSKKVQDRLREAARALLDPRNPGDSNQALMELGATVCLPRNPRCLECPLSSGCRALALGKPESFPAPKDRPPRVRERWLARVLFVETRVPRPQARVVPLKRRAPPPTHEVRLLLQQRQKGEVNQGLLEFPMELLPPGAGGPGKPPPPSGGRARKRGGETALGSVRHAIMSRSMHVHVVASPLDRRRRHGEELILVQDIPKMPISGLTRKILSLWHHAGAQRSLF